MEVQGGLMFLPEIDEMLCKSWLRMKPGLQYGYEQAG